MINPINVQPQVSSGHKGLWGKIAGGAAAVIAAPFTGGASLKLAPELMAAGGLVGGLMDKTKQTGGGGPTPIQTASQFDPGVGIQQLNDARQALDQMDLHPQMKNELLGHFDLAQEELRKKLGG